MSRKSSLSRDANSYATSSILLGVQGQVLLKVGGTQGNLTMDVAILKQSRGAQISPHILVAESDGPLGNFLRRRLQAEFYAVDLAPDGELAYQAACHEDYHLLIVDNDLAGKDGIALVRELRPNWPRIPILALASHSNAEDRVLSLDSGADDCLSKPFSFSELSARVRALLRRHPDSPSNNLQVGDLILNRKEFRVERGGTEIALTTKEFALLEYLMRNAGQAVSRPLIMENVWKTAFDPSSNVVDVYVRYLRHKVDSKVHGKQLIRTVRGIGYILSDR